MKQAKLVSGLIMLLTIAVVGYMAYYIIQAISSPLKTAEAVFYTAEETVSVNGYFLRDEILVPSGQGAVQEMRVSEGDKVSKGEILYVSFESLEARELRRKIDSVESRLSLLREAVEGGKALDITKVDQNISEHLANLMYGMEQPRQVDLDYEIERIKANVLKRGLAYSENGEESASAAISSLADEKSRLTNQSKQGSASVKAPQSGYFSSRVDGYEGLLTTQKADQLTLQDLRLIASQKTDVPLDAYCGRLSTGFDWKFAAAVPSKQAKMLQEGTKILLRFTGDFIGELNVRIDRISADENGECLVVFSGSTKMSELLGLRYQSADIVFSTYEGIRIPKEALRINEDGKTGVYCLVAMQAKFVPTEQIYETDRHYIVKYDTSSQKSLRPGDEIIVSSKNLYDGKIVQ